MRHRGRKRRGPYVWLLSILVVAAAALVGLSFYRPLGDVLHYAIGQEPPPPPLPGERMTFLVMGVDKRGSDRGRSDTMVVVSYDPDTDQLAAVSIPRDTWVRIPGRGHDKLNHSYAYGGTALAVSTVQQFLGIPIDHYVTVSFQGFEEIIDALGGVQIDAEKRLYYRDPYDYAMGPNGLTIDIQPGPQLMDGETALGYARFRMDQEGDFGRMRRQQQVIKAMMAAAARPSVIGRLPELIPALAKTVETDLTVAEMISLASNGKAALSKPLRTATLGGTTRYISGVSYVVSDLVDARTLAYKTLVGNDPPTSFIARAKEDQATYLTALAKATGTALPSSSGSTSSGQKTEQTGAPTTGETGDAKPGDLKPGDQKPGDQKPGDPTVTDPEVKDPDDLDPETPTPTNPADPDPGTSGPAKPEPKEPEPVRPEPTQPVPEPTNPEPREPSAAPAPNTVRITDATGPFGDGLGNAYAALFRSAGLQVTRVERVSTPVTTSKVLDYGNRPEDVQRVKSFLPGVAVSSVPNRNATESVEVVLGTDLVTNQPKLEANWE